jgi:hypothetical protein
MYLSPISVTRHAVALFRRQSMDEDKVRSWEWSCRTQRPFSFQGKTHFCATFEQLESEIVVQQQIPIQIFWPFIVYYWGLQGQRKNESCCSITQLDGVGTVPTQWCSSRFPFRFSSLYIIERKKETCCSITQLDGVRSKTLVCSRFPFEFSDPSLYIIVGFLGYPLWCFFRCRVHNSGKKNLNLSL